MDDQTRQQRKEQKRLIVQKQLERILHAEICTTTQGDCGVAKCGETKRILDHAQHCTDGKTCIVKHCSSTKQSLEHWRNCIRRSCSICQPLKEKRLEAGPSLNNPFSPSSVEFSLDERGSNNVRRNPSRQIDDTVYLAESQDDVESGIVKRLEKIEETLSRAEKKYLGYIQAIDSNLMLLQKNSVERNRSVTKLERTLLEIEKKFEVFENVFQNVVKIPRDNVAIYSEDTQERKSAYEPGKDGRSLEVKQSRVKDSESDNESDLLSQLSSEDEASELDFQNCLKGGNTIHQQQDSAHDQDEGQDSSINENLGRFSSNKDPVRTNTAPSIESQVARLTSVHHQVTRDDFGFKRRRSYRESDNRTVVYQELSSASARKIGERKSRMVDENIANIKRKQPEENNVKEPEPQSIPQDYKSTSGDADFFSRLKYESVDDLKSQMLEHLPDTETWTVLANSEANRGHTGQRIPRGKGPDTCILLDISDSMSGRPFVQMIEAAKTIIMGIAVVAANTTIEENIAVATFGHETRVLQHLTNEYQSVINQLDYLATGGHTPMAAGLLMGLAGCIGNGTGVHMGGRRMHPRIILISDGKATVDSTVPMEDRTAATDSAGLEAVIRPFMLAVCTDLRQRGIKVFWVPIGGSVDSNIPKMITSATGGKLIPSTELDRITQITQMKVVASSILTKYPDLGPNVSVDTIKMLVGSESFRVPNFEDLKDLVEEFQKTPTDVGDITGASLAKHEECDPTMPPIGTRVRRGPTWHYKFQDGEGPGTVIGQQRDGNLWVEWDNGHINVYQYNFMAHDVTIVQEPRKLPPGKLIATGCLVKRGPNWTKDDEDGGAGTSGSVFTVHENRVVGVRWPNKNLGFYKFGRDGKFEVILVDPDNVKEKKAKQNKPSVKTTSVDDVTARPQKDVKSEDVIDNLNKINEEKMKQRDVSGIWEYETENNKWQPYPDDVREKLEKAYRRSKKGLPIIEMNGEIYRVVFSKWLQINQKTNSQARVRRLDSSPT